MTNTTQFDVAAAALQHLELLNHSNQNPLEIAAQFRTLLRSKKHNKNTNTSNINYTYTDYIAADATIRRRKRSHSQFEHRSKSLNTIQYYLNEDQSTPDSCASSDLIKCHNPENLTDDAHFDSAIGSDSSDRTNYKNDTSALPHSSEQNKVTVSPKTTKHSNNSNRFQYPTINWKQLREKQYEHKLDKVKKFLSTKFKTIRLSRGETTDLTTVSSLTNISDNTDSCTYANISELRKDSTDMSLTENHSRSSSRTRSLSSTSIRTPSISPMNSPRSAYTISRLNSTPINQSDDAILFPIADCNLIIKHQPMDSKQRISHVKSPRNENELFCRSKKETIYV